MVAQRGAARVITMFKLAVTTASLALLAAVSSASPFIAQSFGTYNATFVSYYTTSETVVGAVTAYAAPTTLAFKAFYDGSGGISSGTAVYSDGLGNSATLGITGGPFIVTSSTSSVSGTWTFLSGTGLYTSVASGAGTWSASYHSFGLTSLTNFVGTLEPVPEPGSMAALGLGAAALVRRRRAAK